MKEKGNQKKTINDVLKIPSSHTVNSICKGWNNGIFDTVPLCNIRPNIYLFDTRRMLCATVPRMSCIGNISRIVLDIETVTWNYQKLKDKRTKIAKKLTESYKMCHCDGMFNGEAIMVWHYNQQNRSVLMALLILRSGCSKIHLLVFTKALRILPGLCFACSKGASLFFDIFILESVF